LFLFCTISAYFLHGYCICKYYLLEVVISDTFLIQGAGRERYKFDKSGMEAGLA
jgi:hypothetical protein